MALLKSALKSALLPVRKAGGRFFFDPRTGMESSIVWKAAQILRAELVEGDYLEFGVYQGGSIINAYSSIRDVHRQRPVDGNHSYEYQKQVAELWNKMRFFAFDSFRGLPKPKEADCHSSDFVEGQFACDLPAVHGNLSAAGVDIRKVVVVPGWFEETCVASTIKKHNMKAASIIHVDCDLYESAKVVLKFVEPLLVNGTVLIFDDWFCFRGSPELGEQRAFHEWTSTLRDWRLAEYQKEGPWRMSFIASRPLTPPSVVQ